MNTDLGKIELVKNIQPSTAREELAWSQSSFLSRLIEFQLQDCLYFSAQNDEVGIEHRLAKKT